MLFCGRLAQLVRAAGLQPAGRGFESLSAHWLLADRWTEGPWWPETRTGSSLLPPPGALGSGPPPAPEIGWSLPSGWVGYCVGVGWLLPSRSCTSVRRGLRRADGSPPGAYAGGKGVTVGFDAGSAIGTERLWRGPDHPEIDPEWYGATVQALLVAFTCRPSQGHGVWLSGRQRGLKWALHDPPLR